MMIDGLRKEEAEAVYRYCQTQEQAWREKRRIREMEELRAKSGGIHLNSLGATSEGRALPTAGVHESDDPAARLQRSKQMHQQGLISDAEYESVKAKIVSML
jgi:hypothetical protein